MPSDLQYLTGENVEEIGVPCPLANLRHTADSGRTSAGGAMTHVEKMRFQAALKTLRGTGPLHYGRFTVDARGVCAEEEGQAAVGTE